MKTNRTPKQTVQAWCSECVQSTRRAEIEGCGGYLVLTTNKPCPFYEHRLNGKRVPMSAFRNACLCCQGGSKTLVRECEANCLLHDFRMGTNPHLKGANADRLREMRAKRGGIARGFSKNKPLFVKKASAGKKEP